MRRVWWEWHEKNENENRLGVTLLFVGILGFSL